MSLLTEQVKIIKQIYPKFNTSIYPKIRINNTTWILEMLPCKKARILSYINKRLEGKKYNRKILITAKHCSMRYRDVLCHACYGSINVRDLYLSKSSQNKSKFYHLHCATDKHVL